MLRPKFIAAALLAGITLSSCVPAGSKLDPLTEPARLTPATKTGVALERLPPPVQKLDVAVYAFPDLTGQNKPNDSFAEYSRALTQGGAQMLTDVLTKAGGGHWFSVVERTDLQTLLQERQIIQNTRSAVYGAKGGGMPPLRFAGVLLDGGIIGYDSNETTGGLGANYLGIGGNTQYRRDIVTVALRAVSVTTGRVLASVTTSKTIYSVQLEGSAFRFVGVDQLLQIEGGVTRNAPVTLGVQEGIELAVYSLIFEGTKAGLWQFQDVAAGQQFMSYLQEHQRAMLVQDASQRPLAQTNPPAKANQPAAAKSAVGS
ncbi:CsgG/HfaB family protein [Rhizobium sp. S163]|jgi:curli production assembly/transport component CsgG|uniref:CsgG/HfaB family protein n=1 Tax=Rhizobium sp. S163 TaxID=3055039 RepID=UPI001050F83A|nr:CsgG/HfaB family protein [Rhizobium sp. S163]MDM9649150.1 CsgG/HfaB family protein [Rhizobium sp. S163]